MIIPLYLIILFVVDFLFIIYCVTAQKPIIGFIGFIGLLGLATWGSYPMISDFNAFVGANWPWLLVEVVVYLVLGVMWSLFKWQRFLKAAKRKLDEWLKTHFEPVKDQTQSFDQGLPKEETDLAFQKRFQYHRRAAPPPVVYDDARGKFVVLASQHKMAILTWMSLWPFSLLVTMFSDLCVRVWEHVYEFFSDLYQRISDRVFP